MEAINRAVEKYEKLILEAEHQIWSTPETGFREVKSSEYLAERFRELGYSLTMAGDIPGFYTVVDTGREGPEVLVLDEPAAGLDPRGRREILGGLTEYVKRNDATVILVSHSMEDMAVYCDNVVVMNHAEVYRCGTVDEIFSDADALEDIGLDVPAVAKIASALRKKGIDLSGRLYTVEGVRDAIIEYIGRNKG